MKAEILKNREGNGRAYETERWIRETVRGRGRDRGRESRRERRRRGVREVERLRDRVIEMKFNIGYARENSKERKYRKVRIKL